MMESVCTPLIHMESEFCVDDEMILGNANTAEPSAFKCLR